MSKAAFPDKTRIPRATFSLLFSEIVQMCHQKSESIDQFAGSLHQIGVPVGITMLEVLSQGTATYKRSSGVANQLLHLKDKIWPTLFGYAASELEIARDNDKRYMLYDNKPTIVQYISHPQELRAHFTACSYVAGIVEGFLSSSGFACTVTAHPVPENGQDAVVYLITFTGDV